MALALRTQEVQINKIEVLMWSRSGSLPEQWLAVEPTGQLQGGTARRLFFSHCRNWCHSLEVMSHFVNKRKGPAAGVESDRTVALGS